MHFRNTMIKVMWKTILVWMKSVIFWDNIFYSFWGRSTSGNLHQALEHIFEHVEVKWVFIPLIILWWFDRNVLRIPVKSTLYSDSEKNHHHSRVYVLLIVVYLLVNGGKMVLSLNADQICNENESTLIVDISLVMSHLHLLHFAISCVCPLARARLVVRIIWKKKGNFEDGYTRKVR